MIAGPALDAVMECVPTGLRESRAIVASAALERGGTTGTARKSNAEPFHLTADGQGRRTSESAMERLTLREEPADDADRARGTH
ncbi:hypothetical protein CcI49_36815 [Frankia sp. CcI49]|nr:hypothetical protein CcI49_36815 [Frankia sp. CcI49]